MQRLISVLIVVENLFRILPAVGRTGITLALLTAYNVNEKEDFGYVLIHNDLQIRLVLRCEMDRFTMQNGTNRNAVMKIFCVVMSVLIFVK